ANVAGLRLLPTAAEAKRQQKPPAKTSGFSECLQRDTELCGRENPRFPGLAWVAVGAGNFRVMRSVTMVTH
ncbi:MAG TPA: hypothetical protein VF627_10950, partial [Abditibacterium sp.]